MKLGTQRLKITPPNLDLLGGYGLVRYAVGIHDDVEASIFALNEHVFISLDLAGIDETFVEGLRDETGIESVHLFASHTHSGPAGTLHTDGALGYMNYVFQDYDAQYMTWLHDSLVNAIHKARNTQRSCEMSFSKGQAEGFCTNRLDPKRYHETRQFGIEFMFEDGTSALMYSYACHPTILNYQNTLVSRDIVGASNDMLRHHYVDTLFMNGSCADISTRFTRESASFDEVKRLGEMAARGILNMMQNNRQIISDVPIKHQRFHNKVAIRNEQSLEMMVSLLWFEECCFVLMPAEFSSILAQKIHEQTGAHVISMANGYLGYCVEEASFDEESYESSMSMLVKGEIENTVTSLIKEIQNGKH